MAAAATRAGRSRILREVEDRMIGLAEGIPRERAQFIRRYLGTEWPTLGLPVPVQRAALRRRYSFSGAPFAEQLAAYDAVWHGGRFHETKLQALLWVEALRKPEQLLAAWPVVRRWVDLVDCWDMSDGVSAFLGRVLDIAPGRVYPVLARWNRARNPWLRRQSMVALTVTARARRHPPPPARIFPPIEARLGDPDRFVQKGIGWALREAGYLHPRATLAFLTQHAGRLSAIAFAEGSRKLPERQRAALKSARARFRGR